METSVFVTCVEATIYFYHIICVTVPLWNLCFIFSGIQQYRKKFVNISVAIIVVFNVCQQYLAIGLSKGV